MLLQQGINIRNLSETNEHQVKLQQDNWYDQKFAKERIYHIEWFSCTTTCLHVKVSNSLLRYTGQNSSHKSCNTTRTAYIHRFCSVLYTNDHFTCKYKKIPKVIQSNKSDFEHLFILVHLCLNSILIQDNLLLVCTQKYFTQCCQGLFGSWTFKMEICTKLSQVLVRTSRHDVFAILKNK